MPSPRRFLAVLCACALVVAACGDDDDTSAVGAEAAAGTDGEAADQDTASGTVTTPAPELLEKPEVEVPEGAPPADLVIDDLIVGDGEVAEAGDTVTVQYVGVLFDDGEQFDASWDRDEPFVFTLGQGQVIRGWDQGVAGMQVGGRRQLVIPPDLAYGEAGSGSGSIGPGATLVFVVDLVGVQKLVLPEDAVRAEDVQLPSEAPTELVVEDLREGDGAELVEGATATVHYIGIALSTGEVFDSSWLRGQPATFPVAQGQLIDGWVQGLPGMQVGGRRQLVIPPELGYGAAGAGGGLIGPNETLVFVVDLLGVE